MSTKRFKAGTRVYCAFSSRYYTVKRQQGVRVYVRSNQWIHTSNLSRVIKELSK